MENKKVRRTLLIENDLYYQLKQIAVKERITIQQILHELIAKFVENYGK